MLVGICLGAAFVRRQRTLDDPMVDLALFRNRTFSIALGSSVLNVFVSFGSFILAYGMGWWLPNELGFDERLDGLIDRALRRLAQIKAMKELLAAGRNAPKALPHRRTETTSRQMPRRENAANVR